MICKVLIVDDERPMRQWFEHVISQFPEEFQIAGLAVNGEDALRLFHDAKPDIIITDIVMPVMNGLELIQRFLACEERPQFLIVSNYDDFGYVRQGLISGAKDYLLKAEADDCDIVAALRKMKDELDTLNESKSQAEVTDLYSEATRKIVAYLTASYDKKLDMKQLASLVHLNENYISQLFKKETGVTLTKFLQSVRMENAKHLLQSTRLKVNEVAGKVGYPDEAHFSKDFKAFVGMSPKHYSKSI